MSRNRYKRKISAKKIIGIVLVGALLVGILSSFAVFVNDDTRSINFYQFDIGTVSEADGQYIEDKTAIYTKNLVECQGLRIKPVYDSDVTYQIFWYNEDEIYFGCSEETSKPSEIFGGPVPECAKYCRIVIYPSQNDEDGKHIKDFEVTRLSIRDIVKNLEITVDKEQDYEPENLFEGLKEIESEDNLNHLILTGNRILISNKAFESNAVNTSGVITSDTKSIVSFQPDKVGVYKLDLTDAESGVSTFFFGSGGNTITHADYAKGGVYYIEVPETSDGMSFCLVVDDVIHYSTLSVYLPR